MTEKVNYPGLIKLGDLAEMIGRTPQTIRLWDIWSDELEAEGKPRLIPASTRVGARQIRYWKTEDIERIRLFADSDKDLSRFTRRHFGRV